MNPIYQRILLKISGEALLGKAPFGISPEVLKNISKETSWGLSLEGGISLEDVKQKS
jgi:uridylate kinase